MFCLCSLLRCLSNLQTLDFWVCWTCNQKLYKIRRYFCINWGDTKVLSQAVCNFCKYQYKYIAILNKNSVELKIVMSDRKLKKKKKEKKSYKNTIKSLHEDSFNNFQAFRQYQESEMGSISAKILKASWNPIYLVKSHMKLK